MIGVANETSQVKDVNQTEQEGNAPAQERGAPGDQAVRSPQDYEVVERHVGTWFFSEIDVDGYTAKVGIVTYRHYTLRGTRVTYLSSRS